MRGHQSFFFFFFLYSIISVFSISYRQSLHSTFTRIKSEIKVHNIWVKHYDTIQWEIIIPSSSSFIHHFTLFHFIQTLTTLDLGENQIGDQGAKYLTEALQHNSVSDHHSFFFVFFIYSSLHSFPFHTGTHYTQPWVQSNRRSRWKISGWSGKEKYKSETLSVIFMVDDCILCSCDCFTNFSFILNGLAALTCQIGKGYILYVWSVEYVVQNAMKCVFYMLNILMTPLRHI